MVNGKMVIMSLNCPLSSVVRMFYIEMYEAPNNPDAMFKTTLKCLHTPDKDVDKVFKSAAGVTKPS
jgi:hypothetical protein